MKRVLSQLSKIPRQRLLSVFGVTLFSLSVLALPTLAFAQAWEQVGTWINGMLYNFVMTIGGMAVWIGAMVFNGALEYFVLGMGTWMLGNVGIAVQAIWIIIRDTFNLIFIFALIYIGLKLIWDADNSGARSTLSRLIIAALLINFSLFFSQFIVDMSNVLAVQVHNVMLENLRVQVTAIDGDANGDYELLGEDLMGGAIGIEGVPGYFMHLLNLQSSGQAEVSGNVLGGAGYALMLFIFLLFTGLIFAASGIMLMLRFGMLVFYMMISPVMFLGWILPAFMGHTRKWWKKFLEQAFFAPAFLFMLYISSRVLTGFHAQAFQNSQNNIDAALRLGEAEGDTAILSIVFLFISLVFMVMSIVVAQKMGGAGADFSMKMVNRGKVIAGNSSAGLVARAGRNTVGAGASRLAQSEWMKNAATRYPGGRMMYNATKGVADSSFDARQVQKVGAKLGIGEGKKGGFDSRAKEDVKKRKEFLKSIGKRDISKLTDEQKDAEKSALSPAYVEAKATKEQAAAVTSEKKAEVKTRTDALDVKRQEKEASATKLADTIRAEGEAKKTFDTALTDDARNAAQTKLETAKRDREAAEVADNGLALEITQLETKVKEVQSALKQAEEGQVKAETKFDTQSKAAENTLVYKNQLQYVKSLENSARLWSGAVEKLGMVGIGLTAASPGFVTAIPAGITAAATGGVARNRSSVAKALRDEYGSDGSKQATKDKEEKRLKKLVEMVADNQEKPEKTEGEGDTKKAA